MAIIAIVLVFLLSVKVFVEPWAKKKIQTAFNANSDNYLVKIEKVHISILKSGIELENITLFSKQEYGGFPNLTGEMVSINFKGIKLLKVIFKKDINIHEVSIFNTRIVGKMPFQKKARAPKVSSLNISIDNLFFDKLVVEIQDASTPQAYSIKDGVLKVYDLQVEKLDTLSLNIIKHFDFDVQELREVLPDSMYTLTVTGINYSATSNTLSASNFSIQPNYTDYEFSARHKFEIDRIEAGFSQISFHDFSAAEYIQSGNLISSFIEIGEMDMKIFRDNRKVSEHVNKPAFQDMIYNYPGTINIDSIGILSGNITYTEHVEKATAPGMISFSKLNALIYKITNDTIYKTRKAYTGFKAEALLMGKAKITTILKGRLFDRQNTFEVNGSLSGMDANELNPLLEKIAFMSVTSGKIDAMNFSFTANNTKATGQMNLLYHRLNVAFKNKRTDKTTAINERVKSLIANMEVLDSNPMPGKEVRVGIIDYQRNPEKFLFSYCAKSLMSGIKSGIIKDIKGKTK